jgi:hypothetical protein
MKTRLPDLDRIGCQGLTACGELVDADRMLVKWLSKQKEMVASFTPPNAKIKTYVHVMFGGKSGKHVHVDVVKATAFRDKKIPRTNARTGQTQDILGKFAGHKLDLGIAATFICDFNKLPENGLIRSASMTAKTGPVTIRQTRGTFTLSGTPLELISWSIRKSSNEVRVYLEANRGSVDLNDSYLVEASVWIRGLYDVFILGKDSNAT